MKPSLVIGIGNKGRGDDGLGWAFADQLVEDNRFDVVHRYQLQVEDAELISHYDKVWIVDASHQSSDNGFECKELMPGGRFIFTTHALHPAAVVQLCDQLYLRTPKVHLLGISGEDFELGHKLSSTAIRHLGKAFSYFLDNQAAEIESAN